MISIGGIADRRHHVQLSVSVMGVGPIIQVLSEEADLFLFFVFFFECGVYTRIAAFGLSQPVAFTG